MKDLFVNMLNSYCDFIAINFNSIASMLTSLWHNLFIVILSIILCIVVSCFIVYLSNSNNTIQHILFLISVIPFVLTMIVSAVSICLSIIFIMIAILGISFSLHTVIGMFVCFMILFSVFGLSYQF